MALFLRRWTFDVRCSTFPRFLPCRSILTTVKPNFIIIGAAKCGTTSLATLIGRHPDAFMCEPKEPVFFSRDRNYCDRGWAWYESLFEGAQGKKSIGEGSVTYTQRAIFPQAAPRIARDLPDAKLIYMARNPLEQIQSLWMMLHSFWPIHREDGVYVDADFNRSVREKTPLLMEAPRYWKQISWYREYFSDDQILVIFFEDFTTDPEAILARCFEFLGIDPEFRIPAAADPVNPSSRFRADRWFFRPLRLLPGTKVFDWVPSPVRRAVRPLLRRSIGARPEWAPDTRRWVREQLAEDSQAFLTHYGKPAGFWDF